VCQSCHQTRLCFQEYWPAVIKFAQQYSAPSEADPESDQDGAGVQEAVQASHAGVKPPSAVGPFTTDSSIPAEAHNEQNGASQAVGQKYKKEL